MSSPYRESATTSIQCPRCSRETPKGSDLVACTEGCGAWVTSEAAQTAFEPSELKPSRIANWFRTLCDCPVCGKEMTLRGHDMSLFQGCDAHGFWVDDSTVTQTGLGRTRMAERLGEARAQAKAERAARIESVIIMRERDAKAAAEAAQQREAELIASRNADEERARALREAKRQRLAMIVRGAIADDDVIPIVDELMRLEDAITKLANRMTDHGI